MNYFSFHISAASSVSCKLNLTYDFSDQSGKSMVGILWLTEGQLIDLATGSGQYTEALNAFLSSNFDTTDVSRPHAYMVWMLYDNNMQLLPEGSGAKRVTAPNELKQLFEDDIPIIENGYLHAYVSNGSATATSFDNFLVKYARGKARQINHYYPYGLSIAGIDGDYGDYLNKYTGKELQTGEFDPNVSTGLEMLDYSLSCSFFKGAHEIASLSFGSRFYDPQIGRWHTPDPAEQFSNPYLAMGNNPIMYKDPNGEWVHIVIGAVIGGTLNWAFNGAQFNAEGLGYFGVGALAGGLAAGIGAGVGAAMAGNAAAGGGFAAGFAGTATIGSTGFAAGAATGAAAGVTNGLIQGTGNGLVGGNNIGDAFNSGLDQAWKQGLSGAAIGGVVSGIQSVRNGGGFFESGTVTKTTVNQEIKAIQQEGDQNCLACAGESMANADGLDLSQQDIRRALGGDPNLDPLNNNDFGTYFAKQTNRYYGIRDAGQFSQADIFNEFSNGSYVTLSRQSSSGIGHALVIRKAVRKTFDFATSATTRSFRFSVMDPWTGTFERLNWGQFDYKMLQWTP